MLCRRAKEARPGEAFEQDNAIIKVMGEAHVGGNGP